MKPINFDLGEDDEWERCEAFDLESSPWLKRVFAERRAIEDGIENTDWKDLNLVFSKSAAEGYRRVIESILSDDLDIDCECGVKFTGGLHSDWCPQKRA